MPAAWLDQRRVGVGPLYEKRFARMRGGIYSSESLARLLGLPILQVRGLFPGCLSRFRR